MTQEALEAKAKDEKYFLTKLKNLPLDLFEIECMVTAGDLIESRNSTYYSPEEKEYFKRKSELVLIEVERRKNILL